MKLEFPHLFSNPKLRECALEPTHPEFQRLEWLGDRVLGCAVAQILHQNHPNRQEADLSRAFGHLVNNRRLAKIAIALELPGYNITENSGRLADMVEALLGAVLLDAGMEQVCDCVAKLYQDELSDPAVELWDKDPKSMLKEICEAKRKQMPRYMHIQEEDQEFESICNALGHSGIGKGATKNEADSMAASNVLTKLEFQDK